MGQMAVNGTTLYFEEQGSGQPILFIHGMCGDARVWQDQMARLAMRGAGSLSSSSWRVATRR